MLDLFHYYLFLLFQLPPIPTCQNGPRFVQLSILRRIDCSRVFTISKLFVKMCRYNGECAVIDFVILVLLYRTMFLFKFINCHYDTSCYHFCYLSACMGPPLWSSGQSFWPQIQRSWVRFPALPDFLSSSGSGTGSTQPREVN